MGGAWGDGKGRVAGGVGAHGWTLAGRMAPSRIAWQDLVHGRIGRTGMTAWQTGKGEGGTPKGGT